MAEYTDTEKKGSLKKMLGKVTMVDASMPSRYKNLAKCLPCPSDCAPEKQYPCIYLDVAQAPFLKGYEVGDDCKFVVEAHIIGHDMNESKDYSRNEYRLEIRKVGKVE